MMLYRAVWRLYWQWSLQGLRFFLSPCGRSSRHHKEFPAARADAPVELCAGRAAIHRTFTALLGGNGRRASLVQSHFLSCQSPLTSLPQRAAKYDDPMDGPVQGLHYHTEYYNKVLMKAR